MTTTTTNQEQAMTTTPTTSQIESIRSEAARAGDLEMVTVCDQALDGDTAALAECAEVIATARAMEDTEDEPWA